MSSSTQQTPPADESDWFTFQNARDVEIGLFLGDVVEWSRTTDGATRLRLVRSSHTALLTIPPSEASRLLEEIRRFHRRGAA